MVLYKCLLASLSIYIYIIYIVIIVTTIIISFIFIIIIVVKWAGRHQKMDGLWSKIWSNLVSGKSGEHIGGVNGNMMELNNKHGERRVQLSLDGDDEFNQTMTNPHMKC